jgi:XTP/dITP diphosphohydrolase
MSKAGKLEKKMDLLLATRNSHKAREFRELLGHDLHVVDLAAFPEIALPEETGCTLEENAILKALAVSQAQSAFVLADDSGLEVDALNGAPGILSARYAGKNATDEENIAKLLRALSQESDRAACFRCVLAFARNGRLLDTFAGAVEGTIVDLPRGARGFGYDPVFMPKDFSETFAELVPEVKNQISHRARAVRAFRAAVKAASLNHGFGGGGGGGAGAAG